ncbi:MAG: hypothetical protein HQ542_11440, partial [Bacteroidia bacterium]|nr:hypothetical protein [Bacteroidia bacterium]
NDGNATLTISELNMSDPNFFLDESIVLPLTVSSTATVYIGIWFHPEAGIDYDGIMTIVSDAVGQSSIDIDLEGTGIETQYPMGTLLWSYLITTGSYDQARKRFNPFRTLPAMEWMMYWWVRKIVTSDASMGMLPLVEM